MKSKITIIGAGHVGSHCTYTLALIGVCSEIVLIDCDTAKALANTADIADGVSFMSASVCVRTGSFDDITDSAIVVVCVGVPPEPDKDRLDMLSDSIIMCDNVIKNINKIEYKGILISITNPADVVADYIRKGTGFQSSRVFSTGTAQDTARLRRALADFFEITPKSVHAYALGEHGFSAVAALSCATIDGKKITEILAENPSYYSNRLTSLYGEVVKGDTQLLFVRLRFYVAKKMRNIAYNIVRGKNCTEFGIGTVLADVAKAILYNEHRLIPASVLLDGTYGLYGIHAGVPCIIGNNGIEKILEIPLDAHEAETLQESGSIIEHYIKKVHKQNLYI